MATNRTWHKGLSKVGHIRFNMLKGDSVSQARLGKEWLAFLEGRWKNNLRFGFIYENVYSAWM